MEFHSFRSLLFSFLRSYTTWISTQGKGVISVVIIASHIRPVLSCTASVSDKLTVTVLICCRWRGQECEENISFSSLSYRYCMFCSCQTAHFSLCRRENRETAHRLKVSDNWEKLLTLEKNNTLILLSIHEQRLQWYPTSICT